MNNKEKRLNEEKLITPLHETLSQEGKKKLEDILTFSDPLKEKWAEARKKFWSKYDRDQFLLQLRQAEKKREELIKENQQKLEEIWFFTRWKKKQEKFTAEYLKALSLYEEIVESPKQKEERITWEEVQKTGFREWVTLNLIAKGIWDEWAKAIAENLKEKLKEWVTLLLGYNEIWVEWAEVLAKMELKEWVTLDLRNNEIWDEWAEAISNMELKEWVTFGAFNNNIWLEWAEAISNMELKEWVTLDLAYNKIWAEWAKALSKIELKEWVTLDLEMNNIWAKWAEAIAKNMKLKEWVTLNLSNNEIWVEWVKALSRVELKEWVTLNLEGNNIWDEWRSILRNWVADAKARGINCIVLF